MKQYRKGMIEEQWKKLIPQREREYLEKGLQYKVGDIIQACDAFNHRIVKIEYDWRGSQWHSKPGEYLGDIRFTDEKKFFHHWRSCCEPLWTVEQIEEYWRKSSTPESLAQSNATIRAIIAALDKGQPICDKDGLRLPEFERPTHG